MSDGFLGEYYGIDWVTLILGVTGSYITTNMGKLYIGMCVGLFTCTGGMAVAALSHQNGFIVYNALLMCLNLRGLYKGWKKSKLAMQLTSDAQAHAHVQLAAANDPAPARDPFPSKPALAA